MDAQLEKVYESPHSIIFKKKEDNGQWRSVNVLKSSYAHPRSILQFNNEFAILSELDIPGIKKVYSKEFVQGAPGQVANYFDGITIYDFIQSYSFDLKQRLEIGANITHALGLLHQQNIIHRDLTADNILVNPHTREIQI